jgi:DNA-binding NarL/FixJ family response regulator
MNSGKLRVLHLEDDDLYPELVESRLVPTNKYVMSSRFTTNELLVENLIHNSFDIAILDITIYNRECDEVIDLIRTYNPKAMLMILTTTIDGKILQKYLNYGIKVIVSKKSLKNDLLKGIDRLVAGKEFLSPVIEKYLDNFYKTNQKYDIINEQLPPRLKPILFSILERKTTEEISIERNIKPETVRDYLKEIKSIINMNISGNNKLFNKHTKITDYKELYTFFDS